MATIFDVAKYILKNLGETTVWKLHKLCYYSQAWTLAWGEPALFEEDFVAWSNGPVCLKLKEELEDYMFTIKYDEFQLGDETHLGENALENIEIVLKEYGEMEPYDLKEQSQGEEPWKTARNGLPVGEPSETVITKNSMAVYYGGL
ncbi:MAG: DUF4065 domain-containing protein [Defluviitaleaceae bacterium]|nr:DUF4065 domain-containing protein [Defluviitaleaceae bacterium]